MYLKRLELSGFKSFAKKVVLDFPHPISAIVGPNGSGKSNIAEAFRFVLGEQSLKSLRSRRGEDLIFNGSKTLARESRAGVKVVFDNTKKLFPIDFEEFSVERIVHRDGINDYLINASPVRLKDVFEILLPANVGPSGHHIISQGEADRILGASLAQRREIVEDALGLRVYHFKLGESRKKLTRTKENMQHVESLRKEIAPHLRFLKKQVEKVERARELRAELRGALLEYIKRESLYLTAARAELAKKQETLKESENALTRELEKQGEGTLRAADARFGEELAALEARIQALAAEKEGLARELGRLEGELKALGGAAHMKAHEHHIPTGLVRELIDALDARIREAEQSNELSRVKAILQEIKTRLHAFVKEATADIHHDTSSNQEDLTQRHREREKRMATLAREESSLRAEHAHLLAEREKVREKQVADERERISLAAKQHELISHRQVLHNDEERLLKAEEDLKREITEGEALLGKSALEFQTYQLQHEDSLLPAAIVSREERERQEERRRVLEKLKIRLEEAGGGSGEEIVREYEEVSSRDTFLARELGDLAKSASSLETLIEELEEELVKRFRDGVLKVNKEFQQFFTLIFGGGTASLSVIRPRRLARRGKTEDLTETGEEGISESETEETEGIEIAVSLPHKRIKGLEMLSGGERALTSIALLFALSRVNPPPFIVLDETDAALDEANSRRYGQMITRLSEFSQLVLITHNRETMRHAGVLYGVAMGSDGASRLLSVKFDEAAATLETARGK